MFFSLLRKSTGTWGPGIGGALAVQWLACATTRAEVSIQRQAPVVEQKVFDPAHPPKEMPHLNPGEAAVTESTYHCAVSTSYHVIESRQKPENCQRIVKIDAVNVTLQLHITLWLPANAPRKLRDHEEGHRQIAEQIYQERAEPAAQAAAAKLDGRQLSGTGRDCDEAATAALNDADNRLCKDYLDQTGVAAGRVGELFDQITSHGRRYWPAVDEAIRQSFERYQKEHRQ